MRVLLRCIKQHIFFCPIPTILKELYAHRSSGESTGCQLPFWVNPNLTCWYHWIFWQKCQLPSCPKPFVILHTNILESRKNGNTITYNTCILYKVCGKNIFQTNTKLFNTKPYTRKCFYFHYFLILYNYDFRLWESKSKVAFLDMEMGEYLKGSLNIETIIILFSTTYLKTNCFIWNKNSLLAFCVIKVFVF